MVTVLPLVVRGVKKLVLRVQGLMASSFLRLAPPKHVTRNSTNDPDDKLQRISRLDIATFGLGLQLPACVNTSPEYASLRIWREQYTSEDMGPIRFCWLFSKKRQNYERIRPYSFT
jgi:hypothetical protein